MRFVETAAFTSAVRRHLDDEAYRALQLSLWLRPEQGAVLPGGRGLRKLRWRAAGRGKRGGVRVIYYWSLPDDTCLMVFLYAKNEQGDLTRQQLRLLAQVAREEFR
jgi:hypothetical protein